MDWWINIDTALLKAVNASFRSPGLDALMSFLSANRFFMPGAVLCGAIVLARWKWRGLLLLLILGLAMLLGDGFLYPLLKEAIARARPYEVLPDIVTIGGKSSSPGMPSSHAANWFCFAVILFAFWRKSLWITLPLALLVSFSRVYNGMHFPGDILVGAIVGSGCGAVVLAGTSLLWSAIGPRWFPLWWEKFPSVLPKSQPAAGIESAEVDEPQFRPRGEKKPAPARHTSIDVHWVRLGCVFIVVTCLARLAYLASGTIQLTPDEAYQWHWAKHLDLSYYSKPPLIAYAQWLGTAVWGDTEFGVRFLSPLIAGTIGFILLRFFTLQHNARAGFFLLLVLTTTPMLAAGAVLMTVDCLSVLFWTAAMVSGWHALRPNSKTLDWLPVGLWMGLGFLSKYTALFQWLSFATFFVLWPSARKQLRRPGPWLALLICVLCAIPVIVWNHQHGWMTISHLAEDAGAGKPWKFTLKFFLEFVGAEFGLLNPVYFVAGIWACGSVWKRGRKNPLQLFLLCMAVPIALVYLALSFKSRVEPNWIVPAAIPFLCLTAIYWDTKLRLGQHGVKSWLSAGIVIGAVAVVLGHNTDLTDALLKLKLPPKLDPLRRAHAWSETASIAEKARQKLTADGTPAFLIGDHYGITSEISFCPARSEYDGQRWN